MILFIALWWLQQNLNQTSNSQQAPHTSPSRPSYGVSIVRIWEKIDRIITAPHCIMNQIRKIIQPNQHVARHNCVQYSDVIMDAMASQITSLTIVYSTVYLGADQRKHQCSASLAFVRGIHRWPVNSPHKGPVTRKMFPFDDVTMIFYLQSCRYEVML